VITPSQRSLPDNTQHSLQIPIHFSGGIRTQNLSRRAVADLPLTPRAATGTANDFYNYININDVGLPLPFEMMFLIKQSHNLFTLIDFREILYEYRTV